MPTIRSTYNSILSLTLLTLSQTTFAAESDQKSNVSFGAFVDYQYAVSSNSPKNHDLNFTTQSPRDNEFNLNLAYIEALYKKEQISGRLALQNGTSVQSNYSSEPKVGSNSGPNLSQYIQEARLAYALNEKQSIEAGIFFSHLGAEGWISSQNPTLSRSLVADYSPYYLSGVRYNYKPSSQWAFQVSAVNGWQILSENNSSKSVGSQVAYSPNERLSITYSNILGMEQSPSLIDTFGNSIVRAEKFRHFHDFILRFSVSNEVDLLAQFDYGNQVDPISTHKKDWIGSTLIALYKVTPRLSLPTRFEVYRDKHQLVFATGSSDGFLGTAASVGVNYNLAAQTLLRSEYRYLFSETAVFEKRDQNRVNTDHRLQFAISSHF